MAAFIRDSLLKAKEMERVNGNLRMVINLKDNTWRM